MIKPSLAALGLAAAAIPLAGCETVADVTSSEAYVAGLSGAAEVPGPGDADGSGRAEVSFLGDELCYELDVENIGTPTAAHIHRGGPREAGPPVVTLEAPADGDSSGCIDVDAATKSAIQGSPANHYVNVHNAEFPAGAIRGQLVP